MRVLGSRQAAAEGDELLENGVERRLVSAEIRIDTNDGSSLVRPILKSITSNAASLRTTVSNMAVEQLRVDQVAFGFDDFGDMQLVSWSIAQIGELAIGELDW